MSIDGNILDDFEAIFDAKVDGAKRESSKTVGTVSRIDKDGSVWVRLAGSTTDTPCRTVTVASKPGDTVEVEVGGGSARVTGNVSTPSTDDETADRAISHASRAMGDAARAYEAANDAQASADAAAVAAVDAQNSADDAAEAAQTAWDHADDANTAAQTAWNHADDANTAAIAAQGSAATANTAANGALTQLGVVENVVGALDWISEHASYAATQDTTVVPGKFYYTRSGSGTSQNPYVYTYVSNPSGNPSQQGYYEVASIDEAVSNYVSSHLALTNDGLWVVKDNQSYKLLLASTGMDVYNTIGNSVASYGEDARVGASSGMHILITSYELSFRDASNESAASIGADASGNVALFVSRIVATSGVMEGTWSFPEGITWTNWRFHEQEDGNLTLQWIGA